MNRSEKLIIRGEKKLFGEVKISGAKNSALPLMAASILFFNGYELSNIPDLLDTKIMIKLLKSLGVKTQDSPRGIKFLSPPETHVAPEKLVNTMRASILILAPLLQSRKHAFVPLPGGCAIGSRPIDLHIDVVKKLGANVELRNGYLRAKLPKTGFRGNQINFPKVSVGATECAIMAAVLAQGRTEIKNAAREPEIVDLGNCMIKAGAKISGLGDSKIIVEGVKSLNPISFSVIPDRIEAGSFAIAAAITKGEVNLNGIRYPDLETFLNTLKLTGTKVIYGNNEIKIIGSTKLNPVDISTEPHPGFPTDLQAQFMSLMCLANGNSTIKENIFENRFQHVPELRKMGAKILVDDKSASVIGLKSLKGAKVKATDLRASMSLIIAALAAKGETNLFELEHLKRGYENIEDKLSNLGAEIS